MLASQSASATDPEFMDFIINNAHQRGYTQCDAAINDAFANVGGQDIRVITYGGLHSDAMKIAAVFGSSGDAVFIEAEFRRAGSQCTFTRTSTVLSSKSCAAEMMEYSEHFKYEAETAGVTFTKNAGGVNRLLLPVNPQGCVSIYLRGGKA